ncbi:DUF3301 domain-containing protein [Shewanella sp. JM162201]|uniref:DUF3301 domain-containing protein n=1 Tax=Shewanella jiangmenensis TaxID=2837387 RepID=A0ABS5V559_9GAMM|nr:DUF3301 domain-containing protein [Shewanella jiangmenensis]MBT1444751.1 DUF3301 domain-containing protein [Shewanella jiangmenensis]
MMTDLLLLLFVAMVAAFFWQLRQMSEIAKLFTEKECKRQRVQLLAIAQLNARPTLGSSTGIGWKACYLFEFSTDGVNLYRGHIHMLGKKIQKIEWPIFPEPQWMEAPTARGTVGGSCGSRGSCSSGSCR